MAQQPNPIRFAAKTRRGEYWAVEIAGEYAVGLVRRGGRILIDGCERFTDDVDALLLAQERAAA